MRRRLLAGLALVVALGAVPSLPATALTLEPTSTCPQEAVDEISRAIDFVRSRSWSEEPGDDPLTLAPDLTTCEVVLHIGHLSKAEEAALGAGAGPRLAIEYRRDWARPTKVLLVLWIVFGGSGLIWLYRRYARG